MMEKRLKTNIINLIRAVFTLSLSVIILAFIIRSKVPLLALLIVAAYAYISIRWENAGFYILLASIPFEYLPQIFGENLSPAEIFSMIYLMVYALRTKNDFLRPAKGSRHLVPMAFIIFSIVILGLHSLSIDFSHPLSLSVKNDGFILRKLVGYLAILCAFLISIHSGKKFEKGMDALTYACVAVSTYSISGYYLFGLERTVGFSHGPTGHSFLLVLMIPHIMRRLHSKRGLFWILGLTIVSCDLLLSFSRGSIIAITLIYLLGGLSRQNSKILRVTSAGMISLIMISVLGSILYTSPYHISYVKLGPETQKDIEIGVSGVHVINIVFESQSDNPCTGDKASIWFPEWILSSPRVREGQQVMRVCDGICEIRCGQGVLAVVNQSFKISMVTPKESVLKLEYWPRDYFWNEDGIRRMRINKVRQDILTRAQIQSNAFDLILRKPILGYGHSTVAGTEKDLQDLDHSHNIFTQIWIETGIINVVIFLLIAYSILRRIISGPVEPMLLSLGAIIISGLMDYPFSSPNTALLFFMILARTKQEKGI